MKDHNELAAVRLLTADEVAEVLGISLRKLWNMKRDHHLPQPLKVGARGVRWLEEDIVGFVKNLNKA
jgi:predicted DNA-binding transcriptional regulator AlpA